MKLKNIIPTILMAVMTIGMGKAQLTSPADSPFKGQWTLFSQGGHEYSLNFNFYDYYDDPDIIGTYGEENCMDCEQWELRKSLISSESENQITFDYKYGSGNDSYVTTLTMTYDPIKKNVTVSINGNPEGTFNEETEKFTYWYAIEDSEIMRSQGSSSVIGHVKAGDRFALEKWANPFMEPSIKIKLPDNTYGWIKSDNIELGVAEPIKASAFPLSWVYEDKLGEETIKIKRTGGNKVIVSYVNIKYNNPGSNEESQYSGTIKGNHIILTKWRPLHFKGDFTKMPDKKEMLLIPGEYDRGMWRTRLLFEGHKFIPSFVKKYMTE